MKTKANKKNKTVKTYCYGKLHEFLSIKDAMDFYFAGMNSCDGAERDRYLDIYSKLAVGRGPFCDYEGVPEPKEESLAAITEKDVRRYDEIRIIKHRLYARLDSLRSALENLKAEFRKEHADIFKEIDNINDETHKLFFEQLDLEKRGVWNGVKA